MQLSRFTTRLLHIFLVLSIIFFLGFCYMMVTKEIMPALKDKNTVQHASSLKYSVSEIKVYKNSHFKKGDLDVSHQYGFSLLADDSIVYASSEATNGIAAVPHVAGFSTESAPFIPRDKMTGIFRLVYSKDEDIALSSFPEFRFADYLPKAEEYGDYLSREVEVKQVSTDGKMMIYIVLKFQYDN